MIGFSEPTFLAVQFKEGHAVQRLDTIKTSVRYGEEGALDAMRQLPGQSVSLFEIGAAIQSLNQQLARSDPRPRGRRG